MLGALISVDPVDICLATPSEFALLLMDIGKNLGEGNVYQEHTETGNVQRQLQNTHSQMFSIGEPVARDLK